MPVKALVVGVPGTGKTTLATTFAPKTCAIVSMESGLLSIQGQHADGSPLFDGPILEARTWRDLRHLAVWIAGPDLTRKADEPLSQAHYDHVVKQMGGEFKALHPQVETIFLDSLTEAGRLCLGYCERLDAVQKGGKTDTRAVYGEVKEELIGLLSYLRHAPYNVVYVGIMERKVDNLGDASWGIQLVGQASAKELPGLMDEVFVLDILKGGDGKTFRALITQRPNPYDFEAKDRSGCLERVEPPHLGNVFAKIAAGRRAKPLSFEIPDDFELL